MSRLLPLIGSAAGLTGIVYAVQFRDFDLLHRVFAKSNTSSIEDGISLNLNKIDTWDFNWDRRQPHSLVNPKLKLKDPESYEKKLISSEATAQRNIILIRHGQEFEDLLTPAGVEQAEFTAQRLRGQKIHVDAIFHSANQFSRKTAETLRKHLPLAPISHCDLLAEGVPCATAMMKLNDAITVRIHRDSVLFEAAFRKYFHRAPPHQKKDSYEVIIAPSEMIRYCILRSLQLPVENYEKFSIDHGSISWLTILPNGSVKLRRLNDIGHLPLVSKQSSV